MKRLRKDGKAVPALLKKVLQALELDQPAENFTCPVN
jgi:hypothetical protein